MSWTSVVLLLCASLCAGQDRIKIEKIYDDMDSSIAAPPDGNLYIDEVYAFFASFSSMTPGEGLNYFDFDYGWSVTKGYDDPRYVTSYFFLQWDTNKNSLLDSQDLTALFDAIDNDGSHPSIDFYSEFLVHMWPLYANASATLEKMNPIVGRSVNFLIGK